MRGFTLLCLQALPMCPHTATYVSSYGYICVLILLHMRVQNLNAASTCGTQQVPPAKEVALKSPAKEVALKSKASSANKSAPRTCTTQ